MFKQITLCLALLFNQNIWAQVVPKVVDLPITTCDCNGAIPLTQEKLGPIRSTHFGKELEIKGNATDDLYFFDREHNSTWFFVKAPFNGELTLEITPENEDEDLNFLVFLSTGRWFCNKLREGNEMPVRSNISDLGGTTGLSYEAMEDYVSSYDMEPYSASIQMFADDYYYIVIDNTNRQSEGYSIQVNFIREDEIANRDVEFEVQTPPVDDY